ncbi:hypothetical protein JM16_009640 [Phytophthora kernoviae]|uniref:Uncharacterized protein n=1 Tax=Phytophthora kernoviae TaxID=325452 RepID=A0A8T0LK07_9STRA|nr:hypothetical protein JM16_009640 [Phytophthora kernoviae]
MPRHLVYRAIDRALPDICSSVRPMNLRPVVSPATAATIHANARVRSDLLRLAGRATLAKAMAEVGVVLPTDDFPLSLVGAAGPEFLLNKPLQHALSEYARRSGSSLPAFVELVRGQTASDYRPNKNLVPAVQNNLCKDYKHLEALNKIVREGVEVRLKKTPPLQVQRPPNHGSARDRLNVLRKNIRKEQDAGRCLVLDKSLLEQWPEIVISPFGVVEKGDENAATAGRTIHDLSFPEGTSINDCTDQDSIIKPDYAHCDAVASEILRLKRENTGARICVMACDVASAFRNIGIHSNSVYLFAGHIEEDDVIVLELAAPFGWTGSPGFYEIAGGAIAHTHGSHTNGVSPTGFFNYHWVDDHINVAADIGTACDDMDRSLRFAIVSVLGADAINTKKFTNWDTRQRVLGLEFDSIAELVSMPAAKVEKARRIVAAAHTAPTLSRKAYRSLMGSLRHVATCIRAARPFLQRLRQRESRLHRFQSVTVTDDMRQDLLWWWLVLHTPHLNGVSLEYFNTLPPPDIVVEMDASNYGMCALDAASQQALTYQFSGPERSLIAEFKNGEPNGFNINFRELLSSNPSFSTKFASLTPGWLQVSPAIDIQGLTDIWLRISELTPLPTPRLTSTAAR